MSRLWGFYLLMTCCVGTLLRNFTFSDAFGRVPFGFSCLELCVLQL